MRLADGAPFAVHPFTRHVKPGDFLDIQYRRFAEDPALRNEAYRLFHLDLGNEQPLLLINADHGAVVDVLDAKGQVGARARLREAFFDTISHAVWTQLFLHAAESVDDEGESPRAWHRGVLGEILADAFPGRRSRAERVQELLAIRREPQAMSLLAALCDRAIQRRLDLPAHMRSLVEATLGGEAS
jgi:hypothetical protein